MESKKKLNILILSWRGPGHPNAGGAEISTHEHAKGWVNYRHSVTLFTSSFPNSKKEELIDGVNTIRSGNQFFGVHIKAFFWYIFGDHPKFDLVVDQFHGIPFFTPLYVKASKLAFIHEVAKEVWHLNQYPFPFNLITSFLGLFEPLIFTIYRNIPFMTVSQSTKDDLVLWGIPKQNISVIHNGITVPKISSKKENKKTVIYLGAVVKDKGIEIALDVFKYLQNKFGKDIQFWIIGKGNKEYIKLLETKASDHNLNIKFWGYVDEDKKFKLLARSHLLINPSIREGWGLVVIEAAAMGTPTVAFDVPGLRDSILNGKTGIIDKQHSIDSIASEIIALLSDDKKYQKMRVEAVKWSKRFSWKDSIAKSLDLILKIMISDTN